MHYIWKLYLSNLGIPNMVYSNNLQQQLCLILTNTLENGIVTFTGVTSKYLPNVSSFLHFWEKHIIININDCVEYNNFDEEFEIDELGTLYKQKNTTISDKDMIKMIWHYFGSQVEIIDNKYITNISCNLWSKKDDILGFLEYYKTNLLNAFTNTNTVTVTGTNNNIDTDTNTDINNEKLFSFDELYYSYRIFITSKNVVDQKNTPIVSKHFFEKFLMNNLSNFIKFEKFVSSEWIYKSN
jgi:hypothetical protein